MKMKSSFAAVLALVTTLGWARSSQAVLCFIDAMGNGKGLAVKWNVTKIPVWINASKLGAQEAEAITAVTAAFTAYASVTCSNLKFEIKGASTSTVEIPGAILVYWDKDTTWIYGNNLYYYEPHWDLYDPPNISWGKIALNAKYEWTTQGAVAKKIDIQTALTQIIPAVLGFYVGDDPPQPTGRSGSLPITYNDMKRGLNGDQTNGVKLTYYDQQAGQDCVKPAAPQACASLPPRSGDASTSTPGGGGGGMEGNDGGSGDGMAKGDGGTLLPPADDSGCCRVSYGHSVNPSYLVLVGLGFLAVFIWRRRRR